MAVAARQQRELEQTTIHVIAISPLKEGRKMASIKDAEQGWFCIYPDKLSLINKGESYNVEYSLSDDGTTRFIAGTPKHVTPNGRQPVEPNEVAEKVAQVAQAAAQKPRPAMYDSVKPQAASHRVNDPTPERILVCGGLNNAIAAHQVSVHDVDGMITVVNNLRAVWAATLGAEN